MFAELICGLVFYRILKRFFFDDDAQFDLDSSRFNALFAVAKRLEKLYVGSKVYVGLQIPDPDSASRKNIDLVLVTNREAIVISVTNVSGFVSVDKDGNWVCTDRKNRRTECLPNPVAETEHLFPFLKGTLNRGELLFQKDICLIKSYALTQIFEMELLSFSVKVRSDEFEMIRLWEDPRIIGRIPDKVVLLSNITCQSNPFPPEVITYAQWTQLKPEQKSSYSGWIKDALFRGKKSQESFSEKLNSVLCTAPTCDRLEVKGNKCILGEFLEFKGKQDDLQALRKIKRSKVSHLTVQKTSMFAFAHSEVQVLFALRDYRVEGPSWSSQWQEVDVRSSTEVVFRPQNSTRLCKYKLSTITSISLSV